MRQRKAFSLVELSVVLVILGLLIGGILSGQSLIRAAELRAVSTEYAKYTAAAQSFRDKYFAIPGDMKNATSFWAAVAGNISDNWTTTCYATQPSGAPTCNGDGNGWVDNVDERYRFWQHLANAGLIEGSYNGSTGGLTAGSNVPLSKLGNSVWVLNTYTSYYSGSANYVFAGDYGHMLQNRDPGTGIVNLKPEEAWNIDTKLDDGNPSTGRIISIFGTTLAATSCANASGVTDASATYNLTDSGKICELFFLRAF